MSEPSGGVPHRVPQFCPRCGGPLVDGSCVSPQCSLAPVMGAPAMPAPSGPPLIRYALIGLGALSLVVIGVVALSVLRADSTGTQAGARQQPSTGQVAQGQSQGGATSAPRTTVTATATASATGPRVIPMSAQARKCAEATGAPYTEIWAGTDATSCPFSENVAAAYRAAGPSTTQLRKVNVHSPVTNLDYDVTCEPTVPARCMTSTGATVYVIP